VSVARFVADQRAMHRVPHTVTCAILGISISWFYKWIGRGRSISPCGHDGITQSVDTILAPHTAGA
jgi:hypothetical protein